MQKFPSSLDRWLKSQRDLPQDRRFAEQDLLVRGWHAKVYTSPGWDPLRGDNPPMAIVATPQAPMAEAAWLIVPRSTTDARPKEFVPGERTEPVIEYSLPDEAFRILDRVLHGSREPELDALRHPTPVCMMDDRWADGWVDGWIAWQPAGWELLAAVLDRLGLPPKIVLDDWKRQLGNWDLLREDTGFEDRLLELAPGLLVSKSGLLIPWSRLKLQAAGSATKVNSLKSASTPKPTGLGLAMALCGFIAIVIVMTMVARTKSTSKPTELIASSVPEGSIDEKAQPKLERIEQVVAPESDPPDLDKVFVQDQAPLERTVLAEPQEPSSIDALVRDSLGMQVRLASAQEPAPQEAMQKDAEQKEPLKPEMDDKLEDRKLVLAQGVQKREYRIGRGFSAKKAKGVFTLELDATVQDKLHVVGDRAQELVGDSMGMWRIGMDDAEAELVVSVQSKPGAKWQVNCLMQIPSEPGGPLVTLGPKDPELVLGRLAQYSGWLQQTADYWKYSASGPAKPGQPTPTQMARMYSAKQREAERSIKRWREIEQLSALVFDSVSVTVELQPEPDVVDHRSD